jgi:hypothetical protein
MGCLLLHVKFEDVLSILILRKTVTLYKEIGAQNRGVFKKGQILEKPPPTRRWCVPPAKRHFAQ